jgi:hypothetical protein
MVYQMENGKWAFKCKCGAQRKNFLSKAGADIALEVHKEICLK